jgi:hypothetical protein
VLCNVRNRFDLISKKILRGALEPGGAVASQLEIPSADAQAVDTWFDPDPAREASLLRAGLLGRMATGPTMFEPFHNTPGVDDFRACQRKQLALDHARVLEARKREEPPRPAFPRLWLMSSGRSEGVFRGYEMRPMPSFPPGFYEGAEAMVVGVVVLRELPRTRDTLLLRLMGAGSVLAEAVAELARLPEDAWEREVAMPALLAARVEIPQDSSDESEREFLMSTQDLYEEWERKTRERGLAQGLTQGREEGREQEVKRAITLLYEARFGAMPRSITDAIEAAHDTATLERWLILVGTRLQAEIAAALQAEAPSPAS